MRQILLAAGTACLVAGCSMTTAQKAAVLKIGCAVDGVVQPIAAPLVAGLGAAGASAASADALLLHPAVVAACTALGGTPALVMTPPSPAATAAAPAVAPPASSAAPGRTGQMSLKLVFTAGEGISGAVIRAGTWSRAAHVGGLLDGGMVLDATPSRGVALHPGIAGRVVGLFTVACTPKIERKALEWVHLQIGKPYDWTAIAGFFMRRDWHDPEAWFCMELWLAAFEYAGWPLLHLHHLNRGSPRDGMLSPRLQETPVSETLRRRLALP